MARRPKCPPKPKVSPRPIACIARRYAPARRRILLVDDIAPLYSSSAIAEATPTIVSVTFNENITSPTNDYLTGFTIKVDAVAVTIDSAAISGGDTINFTVSSRIVDSDVVTLDYDDTSGDITDTPAGNALASFTNQAITNSTTSDYPDFQVFSNGQVAPEYGTGSETFTRAGTPLAQDYEGVYRAVLANEVRRVGLRRVENKWLYSANFESNTASFILNATVSTNTVTFSSGTGYHYRRVSATQTGAYVVRADITLGTMSQVGFRVGATGGSTTSVNCSVTTDGTYVIEIDFKGGGDIIIGLDGQVANGGDGTSTGTVTINNVQLQHTDGQTDTGIPGELVATSGSATVEYKTTSLANTVASNVVTEATGDPLYPTVTDTVGSRIITRAAQYTNWVADTVYNVGDRVYPEGYSNIVVNPDEDHYFEVTSVAGDSKSGLTEPTWDTTTIDSSTTTDDQVTWTYKGLATYKGVLLEPAGTNLITDSQDLTGWTEIGTPVDTYDQIGITGAANTATYLEDDDGVSGYEAVSMNNTIADSSNPVTARFFIKKDTDETRFPEFQLELLNGSTALSSYVQVNTKTGATNERNGAGTRDHSIYALEDWWVLTIEIINNSSGNTNGRVLIFPARGTTLGTQAATATGSIIVGQVEVYDNTTLEAIQYSSPIITSGASASRTTEDSQLYFNPSNLPDTAGTLLADIIHTVASANLGSGYSVVNKSTAHGDGPMYVQTNIGANFRYGAYDSTTAQTIDASNSAGDVSRIGTNWGSSLMQLHLNGTEDVTADAAYDGSWPGASNLSVWNNHPNTLWPFMIKNLVILNTKLDSSDIETLTGTD